MQHVNGFEPSVNISQLNCGTWYESKNHSSGRTMVAFKNACSKQNVKTIWTVTMKKTDWDEARKMSFEDGDKYTPILDSSCKDAGGEYQSCDIELRKLSGKVQDRAGFLIPATHGNLSFNAAIAMDN
jgi:hypothetical protein